MSSPVAAPPSGSTDGGGDARGLRRGQGRRRARNRRYRRNRAKRSLLRVVGWNAESLRTKVSELQSCSRRSTQTWWPYKRPSYPPSPLSAYPDFSPRSSPEESAAETQVQRQQRGRRSHLRPWRHTVLPPPPERPHAQPRGRLHRDLRRAHPRRISHLHRQRLPAAHPPVSRR